MVTSATSTTTLAVYGGSFDPPHIGHVLVPSYVLSMGLADRVLVCPADTHTLGKQLSPFDTRMRWTLAAMRTHGPEVTVSDLERRLGRTDNNPRGAPRGSSLALLEAVELASPDTRVRLVVGSDIIESRETERWHRWSEIVERFSPIVVPRGGHSSSGLALPQISSAQVQRALLNEDEAARALLKSAVPPAVLAQVREPAIRGSLFLIGTGNVGTHAARWLQERGWGVHAVSGKAFATGEVGIPASPIDGVWVLVGDPHLPVIATRLATMGLDPSTPVLHGAGAMVADSDGALAVLHARGTPVGTLHPICALRREVDLNLLHRCTFGVEGDPAAMALIGRIVPKTRHLALGGFSGEERVRYHAACSLAANFMGAFRVLAARELDDVGVAALKGREALTTLMDSSLFNLSRLGFPEGLTGPVSRGDDAAIQRHLCELQGPARDLYGGMTALLQTMLKDESEG